MEFVIAPEISGSGAGKVPIEVICRGRIGYYCLSCGECSSKAHCRTVIGNSDFGNSCTINGYSCISIKSVACRRSENYRCFINSFCSKATRIGIPSNCTNISCTRSDSTLRSSAGDGSGNRNSCSIDSDSIINFGDISNIIIYLHRFHNVAVTDRCADCIISLYCVICIILSNLARE